MSYQSVVLADSPLAFWRLDELSGTVMTDSSGNARDGVYYSDAGFGMATPIETDASSYAINGRAGSYATADGSALDLKTAYSWEAWGYNASGAAFTLLARAGQWGSAGGHMMGFNGGQISCEVSFTGFPLATYALNYSTVQLNTWYHIVVTRNGSTLLLYVNGYLAAQRTDLPITNAVYSASDAPWQVGVGGAGSVYQSAGVDEAALYDHALSSDRVLAHYEAAKASLPLRATITINVGLELNTDQITPTNFGFAHNYAATFGDGQVPITEELEYKTNINQSEPDYQQRINARPHGALRSLEYHISPASGNARARFQGSLYLPGQFYTLPVWSDYGLTTGSAGSGTNTIPLDTTLRDYEPLSYVGACTDPSDPLTYQFFQIISVSDSSLTLGSNIGTTIPSGSYVFPARVSTISADSLAIKSYAADQEDSVIRFDVIESELSLRRITTYTPSSTYRSIEVFTLESAKVSFIDERPYDMARRIQAHGRDYQWAMDTGSPQTFPVRFLLTSRATLSQFYGWLDARQGKQNPLWVSTKENDLVKVSQPGSGVLKIKSGYTTYNLQQGRRDVQMTYSDGSLVNSRITAVVDNLDGTENISLDTLPAGTVSKISWLKLVTLASDTVQLKHWKGGISECALSFKDLLTTA